MVARVDHLLTQVGDEAAGEEEREAGPGGASYAERLERLARFQREALSHALGFPQVQLVSYSTCSVHAEEDEDVVAHALRHNPAFELCTALPSWQRRGRPATLDAQRQGRGLSKKEARCVVRVDPSEDETGGFFVAVFQRRQGAAGLLQPVKQGDPRGQRNGNGNGGGDDDDDNEKQTAGDADSSSDGGTEAVATSAANKKRNEKRKLKRKAAKLKARAADTPPAEQPPAKRQRGA
jgi:putative methyltransferase